MFKPFSAAYLPHSINTTESFSLTFEITTSVNLSHPLDACEPACPFSTDKTLFNKSTPCSAQGKREPLSGHSKPISSSSSLKIFIKEGGKLIPFGIEKHKPCA